jgi:hypothetical protein
VGLVETEDQKDDSKREDSQADYIVHEPTCFQDSPAITGVFPQDVQVFARFHGLGPNRGAADESGTEPVVLIRDQARL